MVRLFPMIVAATLVVGSLGQAAPAIAQNGQIAAGVAGGLIGGMLLGSALASRPVYAAPPVYYVPAPVYVEEAPCPVVRERFWDGYGWRVRHVQVCN